MSLVMKQPTRDAELKFPCKLYRMLMDTESKGLTHIVSWHKDGRCFRVHDQEAFVKEILPKYFKKSKYRSFQRQCNLYGFHRITAVKPFWDSCYYHSIFIRGEPGCYRKITRPLRGSGKGTITSTTTTAKTNIKGNQSENVNPVTSISRTLLSEDTSKNLISTHELSSSSNVTNVTTSITDSSYSNQGTNNSNLNVNEKEKQKSHRTSYQELCCSILGDDSTTNTTTTTISKTNIKGNQSANFYPVTSISRTGLSEETNVSTQVRLENLISTHVLSSSYNAANVTTPITYSSFSNQGTNNSNLIVSKKEKQKSRRTSYQELCCSILGDDCSLCDDNGQQLVQSLLND